MAHDGGVTDLDAYIYSPVVAGHLLKGHQVKAEHLHPLVQRVRELLDLFSTSSLARVPRAFNADADRLANQGIDDAISKVYAKPEWTFHLGESALKEVRPSLDDHIVMVARDDLPIPYYVDLDVMPALVLRVFHARDDAHDWAEDLLLGLAGVVPHGPEHRRGIPEARSGRRITAEGEVTFDERGDFVPMLGRDQRPITHASASSRSWWLERRRVLCATRFWKH